jgi:hypothetical protein
VSTAVLELVLEPAATLVLELVDQSTVALVLAAMLAVALV